MLVMKNLILIVAFLVVPFTLSAHSAKEKANTTIKTSTKTELIVAKKIEPISDNPKVQNKTINFKKSNELISVKAYIRSLQLRRNVTLMS